jgi:hypothetical protein
MHNAAYFRGGHSPRLARLVFRCAGCFATGLILIFFS